MRISLTTIFKPIAFGIAFLTLFALGSGEANADEVFIAGYTNGCFNCDAPLNSSGAQTDSLFGLSYVNSTFSGTTAGGFRGLGGNPLAPPTQNFNNLGAFFVAQSLANYNGYTFTLWVTFTAYEGIAGSNTTLFTATLVGMVTSTGDGGVQIDFSNVPILFTFNDTNCEGNPSTTCGAGSFFFSVNDVTIDPGQTASLTGLITGAQQQGGGAPIPEPTSMLLLGTGLTGVAGAVRRKLRIRHVN